MLMLSYVKVTMSVIAWIVELSTLKILFVYRVWLKGFEFWRPRLGRTSDFGTPKLGQIYIYIFLYLVTLKILCVQLKRLKSLNFGGPRLGETPILKPQILLGLVYFSYLPIPKI